MDGVLYPFHDEISRFAGKDVGLIQHWNIWDCWGISKKEYYDIFHEFILAGGFEKGEPEENAVAVLKRLSKSHTVNICTSRSTQMDSDLSLKVRMSTVTWLRKIPHQNLFFLREKELVGGLLLDDCEEYLNNYRKAGRSICFDRPWNKDYHGLRVRNWLEFEEIL